MVYYDDVDQNFGDYSNNSNAIYYLFGGLIFIFIIFLIVKLYLENKYLNELKNQKLNVECPDPPPCPKCPKCPECPECICPSVKEVMDGVMPGRNPDTTTNDFFPLNPYSVAAPITSGSAELDRPVNTIDSIYIIDEQQKKMDEIKKGIKKLQYEYDTTHDGYNVHQPSKTTISPNKTTTSPNKTTTSPNKTTKN